MDINMKRNCDTDLQVAFHLIQHFNGYLFVKEEDGPLSSPHEERATRRVEGIGYQLREALGVISSSTLTTKRRHRPKWTEMCSRIMLEDPSLTDDFKLAQHKANMIFKKKNIIANPVVAICPLGTECRKKYILLNHLSNLLKLEEHLETHEQHAAGTETRATLQKWICRMQMVRKRPLIKETDLDHHCPLLETDHTCTVEPDADDPAIWQDFN